MADVVQCENCGAVLTAEDDFCGECGAPRPAALAAERAPDVPPAMSGAPTKAPAISPPPPPAAHAPATSNRGWRAVFIVLVVLGVIACVLGLASFLLFGSIPGENMTRQEDWLSAGLCCLLPIGGAGALLAAAGGLVWYVRLRKP